MTTWGIQVNYNSIVHKTYKTEHWRISVQQSTLYVLLIFICLLQTFWNIANRVSIFRLFLVIISQFICLTSWKFLILMKHSDMVLINIVMWFSSESKTWESRSLNKRLSIRRLNTAIAIFCAKLCWLNFIMSHFNRRYRSSVIWQIVMTSLAGVIKPPRFFCRIRLMRLSCKLPLYSAAMHSWHLIRFLT